MTRSKSVNVCRRAERTGEIRAGAYCDMWAKNTQVKPSNIDLKRLGLLEGVSVMSPLCSESEVRSVNSMRSAMEMSVSVMNSQCPDPE